MARIAKRTCVVTGIKTSVNNFYGKQNHVKADDNMRRNTSCLLYTSDAADDLL